MLEAGAEGEAASFRHRRTQSNTITNAATTATSGANGGSSVPLEAVCGPQAPAGLIAAGTAVGVGGVCGTPANSGMMKWSATASGAGKRHTIRPFGGLLGSEKGAGADGGARWSSIGARMRPTVTAAPTIRVTILLSILLLVLSLLIISSMTWGWRRPGCNPHGIQPAESGTPHSPSCHPFASETFVSLNWASVQCRRRLT